jgi:23S rRNA pseudouridine1911/1915/1917 synthase
VYGGGKTRFEKAHPKLFDGQALHARKLSFVHPTSGERVSFECPLPENFEKALSILQKEFKE